MKTKKTIQKKGLPCTIEIIKTIASSLIEATVNAAIKA